MVIGGLGANGEKEMMSDEHTIKGVPLSGERVMFPSLSLLGEAFVIDAFWEDVGYQQFCSV
jgi:hypothetical protein